jgi:hypothetical protein
MPPCDDTPAPRAVTALASLLLAIASQDDDEPDQADAGDERAQDAASVREAPPSKPRD